MPGGKLRCAIEIAGVGPRKLQRLSTVRCDGQAAESKEALQNLTLIESYIEAFLDQTLNQKHSPLLEKAADHRGATVKEYGH